MRDMSKRMAAGATGALLVGCSPEVDVGGVYFPGWLVSAVLGFVVAYAATNLLSRHDATRDLARNGVFFLGVALVAFFLCWRILFGWSD